MLHVYCSIEECKKALPKNSIDLSKISCEDLCTQLDAIYTHHPSANIYLGFLEPIYMLSPQEETRIRKCIRKFQIYIVVGNPFILPFSWKNGIETLTLYKDQRKNAENAEAVYDGCSTCV